jgi:diguanylate cyclase (GGDEF)-like protein
MTTPTPMTFAILTDYVADYHRQIIRGIQSTLEQAGVGSVVFVGTDLTTERLIGPNELFVGSNAAYDLISDRMNGLIALTGSMGPTLSDAQLLDFFARFAPLPVISIGRELPGLPSVISNQSGGMRDLMRHLIEECGYQRFAFMRGIPGESDSDAREQIFRQALKDHKLEVHEDDILSGDYFSVKAYETTQRWLQGGTRAEVMVCANDDMTFGVSQALEEAGLNVPEDMALTGFDDLEISQHSLPALTTVRQSLFEIGARAASLLLEHLKNHPVEPITELPSELVIRESSQVFPSTSKDGKQATRLQATVLSTLEPLRERFLHCIQTPSETGQSFLREWRNWLRDQQFHNQPHDHGPRLWQQVLQYLSQQAPAHLPPDAAQKAMSLLVRAHAVTLGERQVLKQRRQLNEQTGITWYHGFDVAVMSEDNIPALTRNVAMFLSDLGLNRCYIALFQTYGPNISDTARLVLAFEHGQAQPFDDKPFPTKNLLPPSMQHLRGHTYLQPLFINNEQYGWMMIELTDSRAFYFEALHQTISGGIHNVMQAKRLADYTEFLETRIQERTQALKDSNEQLRAANRQLRQATLQDGLTGVSNRAALDEYLERQLRTGQRHQTPLTFVLCDIDYFKNYNDHYGHLAGDRTLRDVAQTIKQSLLRSEDMVARYGGEEFALVLPNTDLHDAQHVIERIHRNLMNLNIAHKTSSTAPHLTLSMGAISLIPDESNGILELIHTADLGLYEAKAAGRNTVIWQTELRDHQTESRSEFMLKSRG